MNEEAHKCRILWQKVVYNAVVDGLRYMGGRQDVENYHADAWLRDGGRDYWEVMSLSGIDGRFLREMYCAGRITLENLRNWEARA